MNEVELHKGVIKAFTTEDGEDTEGGVSCYSTLYVVLCRG